MVGCVYRQPLVHHVHMPQPRISNAMKLNGGERCKQYLWEQAEELIGCGGSDVGDGDNDDDNDNEDVQ